MATRQSAASLEASRLGDLPNAGYATLREKTLTDAVMMFMRETERDRLLLLSIVLDGRDKWRSVAGAKWSHLRPDTQLLDDIHAYFTLQAGDNPEAQRDTILRMPQFAAGHGRR